jgi:Domain of unknown function (DUF6484)
MTTSAEYPTKLATADGFLSARDLLVRDHDSGRARAERIATTPPAAAPALIVGRLAGFTDAGVPFVDYAGNDDAPKPVAARTTVALQPSQVGSEVVLSFADSDRREPIILGCLVAPVAPSPDPAQPTDVELNGKRLEFTAEEEIVLRCGKSSIMLTQAGKVIIRGAYLLSRSSGVNRIKGGSVQIN